MPQPPVAAPPPLLPVLIHALDRTESIADLIRLIFLAGEGLGSSDGAAISRAALMAGDQVAGLRAALERGVDAADAAGSSAST